ncbi:MAG: lipid-A-disaccharide synthase [Thermodesulfobacteriota bacterium]
MRFAGDTTLPRVMIVAGEASGDLHGANLVAAAKNLAPDLEFFGMGGERLKAAGVELLFDLEHMSLMGLVEVMSGLGRAWTILRALRGALKERRPEAVILIDYPDFNFMLARTAHKEGVPVFYYICPQIWAWRSGRIKLMADLVDRRIVVFPFEVEFYRNHGLEADFVGHPLLDIMPSPRPKAEVKAELGFDPGRELLLLMPGSRKKLVKVLLPTMLEVARRLRERRPSLALVLARADTLPEGYLESCLDHGPEDIRVLAGRTHALQNAADAALVASGTSTLETALMLTPMVVIYRVSFVSYWLGRLMIRTDHVAAANLIAQERVVPELLQGDASPERITAELTKIFDQPDLRAGMVSNLARVRERLGRPGASRRAAELLLKTVNGRS